MRPRIILQGEIGCGKSTLIRENLGHRAKRAGGFLTYRVVRDGAPMGFFLDRACRMEKFGQGWQPGDGGHCFLSFSSELKQEERVFSSYGVRLLLETAQHPFSVLDEIGGMELLEDAFWEALQEFFYGQSPCLAVLKTEAAVKAMRSKVPLGEEYVRRYERLCDLLSRDKNSCFCTVREQGDPKIGRMINKWVEAYER